MGENYRAIECEMGKAEMKPFSKGDKVIYNGEHGVVTDAGIFKGETLIRVDFSEDWTPGCNRQYGLYFKPEELERVE